MTLLCPEHIDVLLHENHKVPLLSLFEDFTYEDVAKALYHPIKHEVVSQIGLQVPGKTQGQSAEEHKEPGDKDAVRKLLVTLSGDDTYECVIYGEEVHVVPKESRGPTGYIDLIIGTKGDDANKDLVINHKSSTITYVCNPTYGETKQESTALSASYPVSEEGPCLVSVARPVTVLLSVAQVQKSRDPQVLFYGSRSHIRPFLYFKSSDRLFTTLHEFQWKDRERLNIAGVCAVAMLLRTQCAVDYEPPEVLNNVFDTCQYPKTGFMAAMTNSAVDLSKSALKCTIRTTTPNSNRKRQLQLVDEEDDPKNMPEYLHLQKIKDAKRK